MTENVTGPGLPHTTTHAAANNPIAKNGKPQGGKLTPPELNTLKAGKSRPEARLQNVVTITIDQKKGLATYNAVRRLPLKRTLETHAGGEI